MRRLPVEKWAQHFGIEVGDLTKDKHDSELVVLPAYFVGTVADAWTHGRGSQSRPFGYQEVYAGEIVARAISTESRVTTTVMEVAALVDK